MDTSLKDFEGYTAFDLYNSTLKNTKPPQYDDFSQAELFTWGANRCDWLHGPVRSVRSLHLT